MLGHQLTHVGKTPSIQTLISTLYLYQLFFFGLTMSIAKFMLMSGGSVNLAVVQSAVVHKCVISSENIVNTFVNV